MRIVVRKCPYTGKLFEDDRKYAQHLSNIRARQRADRKDARVRAEYSSWLRKEKQNIHYVNQIIPWFLKNQRQIMDAANALLLTSPSDRKYRKCFTADDVFENMSFEHISYKDNVSNTHRCPDGGVTNFTSKEPGKPTGYPGWKGYIKGTLKRNPKDEYAYPYGEALNVVGLKTGSGGGGNKSWGYDVSIFLSDWPGLQVEVTEMEMDMVAKKLTGA